MIGVAVTKSISNEYPTVFASKLLSQVSVYGPSSMGCRSDPPGCDYGKPTTQAVLGVVHVN